MLLSTKVKSAAQKALHLCGEQREPFLEEKLSYLASRSFSGRKLPGSEGIKSALPREASLSALVADNSELAVKCGASQAPGWLSPMQKSPLLSKDPNPYRTSLELLSLQGDWNNCDLWCSQFVVVFSCCVKCLLLSNRCDLCGRRRGVWWTGWLISEFPSAGISHCPSLRDVRSDVPCIEKSRHTSGSLALTHSLSLPPRAHPYTFHILLQADWLGSPSWRISSDICKWRCSIRGSEPPPPPPPGRGCSRAVSGAGFLAGRPRCPSFSSPYSLSRDYCLSPRCWPWEPTEVRRTPYPLPCPRTSLAFLLGDACR